jgi:pimeloyl-ACP methyl ester carboxylesterase
MDRPADAGRTRFRHVAGDAGRLGRRGLAGRRRRFHVFAIDKLASGLTGNPRDDKDYNIQGEVEHAYQFIKTMRLDKVHVIGQSRGGGLVFFLAVAHPEIVRTLVMIDTLTAAPAGRNTSREEAIGGCPKEPDWVEWRCRQRAISYKPDVAFDDEYFEARALHGGAAEVAGHRGQDESGRRRAVALGVHGLEEGRA